MVIGICGGSGSGKTTLLRRISDSFKTHNPAIFSLDNYYFPIEKQSKDSNGIVNFDLPSALNEKVLSDDLENLILGKPIKVKEYFFNSPPDKNVLLTIEPSQFIIVEGLFLFHYKKVRELIDYSIFIDVDHKIQLDRRLYRDQETRGYKREDIVYQWNNHVLPCFEQFILPYKSLANHVFLNDHRYVEEFKALESKIKRLLE